MLPCGGFIHASLLSKLYLSEDGGARFYGTQKLYIFRGLYKVDLGVMMSPIDAPPL